MHKDGVQMQPDEETLNAVTRTIIGRAYRIGNVLGFGFLEKVYENALAHELRKAGLDVQQQYPIPVYYDGELVGNFVADLLINGCVLIELKSIRALEDIHAAQCLNYLKATGLPICLLINFGRRIDVKRFVGART